MGGSKADKIKEEKMENLKVLINKDIVLGNDLPIVIIAGP
jgi:hypothetical protein